MADVTMLADFERDMDTIEALAKEREYHWLRCKDILGLPAVHDYKERHLWQEGITELVDFMNYMSAEGQPKLRQLGKLLAAKVLDESRKGE